MVIASLLWGLGFSREAATQALAQSCAGAADTLVVIERLQGGFAGQSGERISIDSDGCFTVERVLNDKVLSQVRSGRLRPEQVSDVRAALDAASFASLPQRSGNPPTVNAALLSITHAGITRSLAISAGATLRDFRELGRGSSEEPTARLARLAARLLELTGA